MPYKADHAGDRTPVGGGLGGSGGRTGGNGNNAGGMFHSLLDAKYPGASRKKNRQYEASLSKSLKGAFNRPEGAKHGLR